MCGIVGYSGPKEPLPILIAGLSRLEYRGYDSAGIAVSDGSNITIEKIINESYENHISKIIVVTGKGLHSNTEKNPYVSKDFSILKYSVPEYIKNNLELMKKILEIKDADIEDGGTGAFYIFLKKKL